MFRENVTMENVTLNPKEQQRLKVLNAVNQKKLSLKQAAQLMETSLRHAKRLLAGYRQRGAAALAHGNRGRIAYNKVNDSIRAVVVDLARNRYRGFNQQHFSEKLRDREGIPLSLSTVRRILLKEGISSPRKRRAPQHRSRRERYPQAGMLLQTDGSPHDWLEGRGPRLCLIGAIDDATDEVPQAFFQYQEDSAGYLRLLQAMVLSHGIPLALYHDQHTIFESPKNKEPSLAEQLAGKKPLTQLGRVLKELGINSISANSPQAKGRVERLWRTFQDRLVSELRLAGACTLAEANHVLREFLPEYNRRFSVPAKELGSAYRQLPAGFKPEEYFCFKYPRTVGGDNVVRFGQQRLQVLPSPHRQSYAHCQVEVQQRLDGSLAIYYGGQALDIQPAPEEAPILRRQTVAPITPNPKAKEPALNPWRRWVYR
jgi:transposase